jgi:Cu+-exporting ATPase
MKATFFSLILAIILVAGAFFWAGRGAVNNPAANVVVVDGKQVIDLTVKGGYSPRVTEAKANLPTILKMTTNSTFDCSASVSIPSLNYHNHLPSSGETFVELPPQTPGSEIRGLCSMGMYGFTIRFN